MKESKVYTSKELEKFLEKFKNKVPIYRGCGNKTCFCTGECKEIIGYWDKLPGEDSPYDFSFPFNKSQVDPSRENYERELKKRQEEHLERVRKNTQPYSDNWNQGFQTSWRPCMHDQCTSCHGTGIKYDGSSCIHMISCPCPKCSPTY